MKTAIIPVPTGVKGYIFDLDGTIIDSMPMHLKSYNYALEVWGIVYPKEVFQSRAGIPTLETLEMIAEEYDVKNPDYDEVIGRIRYYEMNNSGQITMIEPIHDIIKEAYDRLPMAIGTGNNRKHVDLLVDQFSLDQYIPHIVTATEVTNGKPHPETFLKCAELIGIEPGDCVVFEDGVLGIQAAEAAGMQVVDVTKYL